MRTLFSILSLTLFLSTNAFADIRFFESYVQKKQLTKKLIGNEFSIRSFDETPGLQKFTFEQKLNHADNKDQRKFTQRYFINSDHAGEAATSPVLLYICGEAQCNTNRSILEHAKELKAHVVYVEHRYYGKSTPTTTLTTENLKYLSTEMALEDLRAIQQYLQAEKQMNGKWIAIGGSYAGSLAAYYRLKYPDLVVGALSSSGPVMAKENFEEYDLHVSKVVGKECGSKMKEAVQQIESLLNKPDELLQVKKRFQGDSLTDNVDFLYLVADMGAFAVQYGFKDRFCELVNSEDPLSGYATFTRETFMLYGMTALDLSAAGALEVEMKSPDSNMRQWFYQSCTEYGYWQNAYHDSEISVRSALINSDYHRNICKRLFGLNISGNEKAVNETYYEPLLKEATASNIYYTNGSEDPWLNLSIAPENTNDTNKLTTTFTMKDASHCSDLKNPTVPDVKKGRQLFVELAREWLAK